MRYFLKRVEAFSLFLEDGRVAIDNNPAEQAIRPISMGRKNVSIRRGPQEGSIEKRAGRIA